MSLWHSRSKTLSDTQKQVQIGTLAPIEVVRAQSTVATDQQSSDGGADQPAIAAVADEERAQPDSCRSPAGRCGSDSHLHHAIAGNRAGGPDPGPGDMTRSAIGRNWQRHASLWPTRKSATRRCVTRFCRVLTFTPTTEDTGIGGNVALPTCPPGGGGAFDTCFDPTKRRRRSAMAGR